MTQHAKLSPSSAYRWLQCPGSIRMTDGMEDVSSIYAIEGTRAHDLAEKALNARVDAHEIDGDYDHEMVEHIQSYLDYIRGLKGKLYVEVKVNLTDFIPDGFGTSDAILVNKTIVHVADLKYGMRSVYARDNQQMMLYAAGAVNALHKNGQNIKTVHMHICQPRIDNWDTYKMSAHKLLKWAEDIRPKAELCLTEDAPLRPSEAACFYCLAAPTCPALHAHALEVVGGDFEKLPEPSQLTPEELSFIMANRKLVESWLQKIETRVEEHLMNGTEVPGFKLVHARTHRRLADNAEQVLVKLLKSAAYREPQLITLGAAEKLIGKAKFEELGITVKPEGKPTVVPVTDSRPAITLIADDFSKQDA